MKLQLISCAALLLSQFAGAVTVSVQAPCDSSLWLETQRDVSRSETVGQVTTRTFEDERLEFEGSESGIKSIKGTPTGDKALEVIGEKKMRSYGWCYLLNGERVEKMPNEVKFRSNEDSLVWYFGYAEYENGRWTKMCEPTHTERPAFICQ